MTKQTLESQGPARAPAKRRAGAGRRAHKFPFTLHPTGQFCKKIRGKIHYFGKDKQEALRRYYEQASALHAGASEPVLLSDRLTLEDLCNLYLDHQLGRAQAGEIRERQYHEQKPRLRAFADFIGRGRLVREIKTISMASAPGCMRLHVPAPENTKFPTKSESHVILFPSVPVAFVD